MSVFTSRLGAVIRGWVLPLAIVMLLISQIDVPDPSRLAEDCGRWRAQFVWLHNLADIIGLTRTLLEKLPRPLNPDQEEQFQKIQSSANRLLSLINDLLDLAKLESGNLALAQEPIVQPERGARSAYPGESLDGGEPAADGKRDFESVARQPVNDA